MNTNKISKFILELRKEKNMTQQELADMLFVTDKAVSKWERGVSLPDVSMFEKIAEVFNISIADLLNGEKINNKNDSKLFDKILINSIENENKKVKQKNKIIVLLISLLVIITFIFLAVFFYKNYNNILSYEFTGYTDNFGFYDGQIIYSKTKNKLDISGFELRENSEINPKDLTTVTISISFDNKPWGYNMYEYDDINKMRILDWLKNVHFGETVNSEKCKKGEACAGDSFLDSNKNDFPENMQMEIEYCNTNNECKKETFKINTEKIASNKFFD